MDDAQRGATTTLGQNGPGCNGNEEVLPLSQTLRLESHIRWSLMSIWDTRTLECWIELFYVDESKKMLVECVHCKTSGNLNL